MTTTTPNPSPNAPAVVCVEGEQNSSSQDLGQQPVSALKSAECEAIVRAMPIRLTPTKARY